MAKNSLTSRSPLMDKLIKASGSKLTNVLSKSVVLNNRDNIVTSIPAINIAFSGQLDVGYAPGLIMLAGPSKHFKTLFMLIAMKAYLDKYEDAVAYLFDAEFGAALAYFDSVGIDTNRVVHDPITDIEDLKHKVMNVLKVIERGDHVFIGVDSVGNLASKKEVDDALDNKQVVDMTRAKALKSLGRMITPHLTIKDIPMAVVNHTYKTLEMYSTNVVGGGTGLYYSANEIWIIGREQEKDGKELLGYQFNINIEKSRTVKEKSKIPVTVLFNGGIDKHSGLLDFAKEFGIIAGDMRGGLYFTNDPDNTTKDEDEIFAMLESLLTNEEFKKKIADKFVLASSKLITDDLDEIEID